MKTIRDKRDFEDFIHQHQKAIFFVHSPWSETSMFGLACFKELSVGKDNFVLIDNAWANSFMYDWLKDQEAGFELNGIPLEKRTGSWIHGNGELFGVANKLLIWFEPALYNLTYEQIKEKGYF